MRYSVLVESASREDMKTGRTATCLSKVIVIAGSPTEAQLVACQMVACHDMPTKATLAIQTTTV